MVRTFMIAAASTAVLTLSPVAFAQQQGQSGIPAHAVYQEFKVLKWEKTNPELGTRSPEVAILHVDPKTQATQLLIRNPKNFVVPRHWHTANEAITVISGTFIIDHDGGGKRVELGVGSFGYMPAKMVHQAWTKPDEEALLSVSVDGAWDINWVDGPGAVAAANPQ
jgi:anti-sigma factor ChrR (cupin superfamily)